MKYFVIFIFLILLVIAVVEVFHFVITYVGFKISMLILRYRNRRRK